MSGDTYNLEREIAWNLQRAYLQAMKNPPAIPISSDLVVSVEIRVHAPGIWPGEHPSGRSKSALLGEGTCAYRGYTEEPQKHEEPDLL